MQKFKVEAIIRFYPCNKLSFSEFLEFEQPDSTKILLKSSEKNGLIVEMDFLADSSEEAKSKGEYKLWELANCLSWFEEIPIVEARIKSIVAQEEKEKCTKIQVMEFLTAKVEVSVEKKLGKESLEKLKNKLQKVLPSEVGEILFMWRTAISSEEEIGKYFLLYRILEKIIGTTKIEEWIKSKEPSVELINDKWRNKKITIYTFLRDNVHPKQNDFPFEKIKAYLPKLQNLAKIAIKEKFNI